MKWKMKQIAVVLLSLGVTVSLAGCGSDAEALSVDNKQGCIVEVSRRLLACAQDAQCEAGIARYAGYCYNKAPGDQLDICRGGDYFFQQPLADATREHPEVAQLDSRQREIIIRSGEFYCNFNYN